MKKYHMLRVKGELWAGIEAQASNMIGVDAPELAKTYLANGVNNLKPAKNVGPAPEKNKKTTTKSMDINNNKIWYDNLTTKDPAWLRTKADKDFFNLHVYSKMARYDEARAKAALEPLCWDKDYEPEDYSELDMAKEAFKQLYTEAHEKPKSNKSQIDPASIRALKEHNAKRQAEIEERKGE